MICEELEKEITSETCAAMKKHSWCDRSCEQKPLPKNGNGGNVKSPQNNPIAIDQPSQISTIAPKEVQSTGEATKTIVGHSVKAKADIMGVCGKTGDELTWGACKQRKNRSNVEICRDCDFTPFKFYYQPKGRGWINSASRMGDRECPELDGRKLKKSTCLMRAGKKRKAGQECIRTCQYWKGEKIMKQPEETQNTVIWCAECSTFQVEHIGDTCKFCVEQMKNKVRAALQKTAAKDLPLVAMWCPTCQAEKLGVPGSRCGECEAELQVRQPALVEPMGGYFCRQCGNPVDAMGALCNYCYKQVRHAAEEVKPNHVKLVGLNSIIVSALALKERYEEELERLQTQIANTNAEIVKELQKAVKEVEGV